MDRSSMSGRTLFVAALLVLIVGSLAITGVGGLLGSPDTDSPSVRELDVENKDDRNHTVDVLIERDDEIIYWTTFELGHRGIYAWTSIDAPIENGSGRLSVTVRLDGEVREDQDEWGRSCTELIVFVTEAGDIEISPDDCR